MLLCYCLNKARPFRPVFDKSFRQIGKIKMSIEFTKADSYVAKLQAFTYDVTGLNIPISDLTMTGLGIALLILCLRAPIFDTGR